MDAELVIQRLKGWNKPTKEVDEKTLPACICQEGTGCDCKGCDKDAWDCR